MRVAPLANEMRSCCTGTGIIIGTIDIITGIRTDIIGAMMISPEAHAAGRFERLSFERT